MSQCFTDDADLANGFSTVVTTVSPKFPEEAVAAYRATGNATRTAKDAASVTRVVANLRKRIDTAVFRLLVTAQSRDQFGELRSQLFPQFVELSSAISTLVSAPRRIPADISKKVFADLANQFHADDSLLPSINQAKEEALFSLDTLHRAHLLAEDVRDLLREGRLPVDSQKGYAAAISHEWWSILHLRCISFAIRHKISPTNEVLACLLVGLRHSVMSYANARVAMEPRYHSDYDSVDFASLKPNGGDYAAYDNAYGD